MSNFRVGQKVVALKSKWHPVSGPLLAGHFPVKGDVYTVSEIDVEEHMVFLTLEELGPLCGFSSQWFRPVAERQTDISIFKALLTPSRETARD